MERGVRGLQEHPAICRAQCGDEYCAVQNHLLVGMEPPAARPRDRHCLTAATPLFPMAIHPRGGRKAATVADRRPWRAAGRGRLVDGGLGAVGTNRGVALSAGGASRACAFYLFLAPLAGAAAR